ncbi:MAG: glycosyltransferase family 2 protein [Patescibacteria group bacterium]|nr:glycosyltransferase family 2 protein [Patescibacteria group bacterium]
MASNNLKISVVLPCLNEEKTIGVCLEKIKKAFEKYHLDGEIIVVDNGSTDRSGEIAKNLGAIVVFEPKRGYGNAYHRGIAMAKGDFIIIGDADNTYDFGEIDKFIGPLKEGYDLVIGNRFSGLMKKRAMGFWSRIGNPILSSLLRLFFRTKIHDAHCGMRAFTRTAYDKLNLQTTGMEYASEMIVKAIWQNLKIKEVPITYYPRVGESKLSPWRDGWRHLKFMLIYAPNWLFLGPGIFLFSIGLFLLIAMTFGELRIGKVILHLHPMFLGALLVLLGYQVFSFGLLTKLYAYSQKLMPRSKLVDFYLKYFSLEKLIFIGLLFFFVGLGLGISVYLIWARGGFGALFEVRKSLTSITLMILGMQIIFTGFFYHILRIGLKGHE